MEKIVLEYDRASGEIKDGNGLFIASYIGHLKSFEEKPKSNTIDELIQLKEAGFTTDEIIELRRKELI
jgi:hypothetical protein